MNLGQHVDLLILLIQQVFQFSDFEFERSHSIFERFGISAREGSSTELIAGLAFESDIGALGAAWANAITANLLASASIAGLRNTTLCCIAHPDDLHGQNARHRDSGVGRLRRDGRPSGRAARGWNARFVHGCWTIGNGIFTMNSYGDGDGDGDAMAIAMK